MGSDEIAAESRRRRIPPGLPSSLTDAEKPYALYEDVDYREYWADPAQTRQDALEHELIADLLPQRGARIIDVGGGYGRLAPVYLDRFESAVLYDGSMSLLRRAREALGERITLVAGDVTRLPFSAGAFDAVLNIRVLNHIGNVGDAVAELGRVMARGGTLVFSYHNKRNARRVATYLGGKDVPSPFSRESAEVSPALISHHPDHMGELLGESGFTPPLYRGAAAVDSAERFLERLGSRTSLGRQTAPLLGRYRLAPWLIGRTSALEGEPIREAAAIGELFECPSCRGALREAEDSYVCTDCLRRFPVTDGIADFRL